MMNGHRALLTGVIGGDEYALPLGRVHEVVPHEGFTRVPTAPSFVIGLIELHGAAVPVLDLARKFGAVRPEASGYRSIIVVHAHIRDRPTLVGIVIDRLGRVFKIDADQIQPTPPLESVIAVEFLTGVFERDGRFVLCIDVDRLLGADEAAVVADLARPAASASAEARVARLPYLCVRMADSRCALPLARLHDVLPCGPITHIPGAPAFVLGATNVRGAVVPVIDLARRHGLAATRLTAESCLVLVQVGEDEHDVPVGLLIEGIDGLVQVRADEIDRTPAFGARFPASIVQGMTPILNEFVPILDTERALADTVLTSSGAGRTS
jgi:purine-binding chemotaxis protein CheW